MVRTVIECIKINMCVAESQSVIGKTRYRWWIRKRYKYFLSQGLTVGESAVMRVQATSWSGYTSWQSSTLLIRVRYTLSGKCSGMFGRHEASNIGGYYVDSISIVGAIQLRLQVILLNEWVLLCMSQLTVCSPPENEEKTSILEHS